MGAEESSEFTGQDLLCPERTARYRLTAALYIAAALYGGYNVVSLEQSGTALGWPVYLVVVLSIIGGGAYAVSSSGTSIDLEAGVVVAWWSVLGFRTTTETPLDQVERVELKTVDRFVSGTSYRLYRVVLMGSEISSAIWMGESPVLEPVAARARALSDRLGLPLSETN